MGVSGTGAWDRGGLATQPHGQGDADKILHHFFSDKNLFSTIPHSLWGPPTDVYETPGEYVIRMEIPGVGQGNVAIELNHNVLTIQGHRYDKSSDVKLNFHRMEIHYGYFEKVVTLPHSIDPDVPPAKYSDGFLCISIRKAEPRRSPRRQIEIGS